MKRRQELMISEEERAEGLERASVRLKEERIWRVMDGFK